ncbi:MAG: rRNA pseudouridine synthase [Clostridia bacterium]|nr:rRNA pseudouridine synthase [Clostridia bacterium]
MQRLDKILSDAGVASRKQLKAMIRAGRVLADGVCVTDEAAKFDEASVQLTVDGECVSKYRKVLLMMHKPAGLVTSTDDPRQETVMKLVPEAYRKLDVSPVGRLDKDTEGLLLLTNDGDLAHRIISPKHGVWKTYYAEHEGEASQPDISAFEEGLVLSDGTKCLPAKLQPQGKGKSLILVQEGKYHQVRRMMASRGMTVYYLKRIAEGALTLGDLPKGEVMETDIVETERLITQML